MAYNNYNGGYSRNYNNRGYSRGYNGGGGYQERREPKKHSGARYMASSKNGNPVIAAWNYSRKLGVVSILIAPYKGSKKVKSKSGREWGVWMCSIKGKAVSPQNFPVLVDLSSHKAIIREWGWVVNPGAPNGGYCGTFSRNNNRR